jgi:hypothetical protein
MYISHNSPVLTRFWLKPGREPGRELRIENRLILNNFA